MKDYHNVVGQERADESMVGASLRSKGDTAQMNEVLCKVLCHNICVVIQSTYELGVPVDFCG